MADVSPDEEWILFITDHFSPNVLPYVDIYRMRVDGSGMTQVFRHYLRLYETLPVISYDQRWIAFSSAHESDEGYYIYLQAWDETSARRLTNEVASFEEDLIFTPDSQAIIYHRGGGLNLVQLDGSTPVVLNSQSMYSYYPQMIPNQQAIIFISETDGSSLYRVNLDGTGMQELSTTDRLYVPQITPDGQWIIFSGCSGICRIHPDGSNLTNLSKSAPSGVDHAPVLSLDGEWIFFKSIRDNNVSADIYRMRIDGSGVERLTAFSNLVFIDSLSFIPLPPMPLHSERLLGLSLLLLGVTFILIWVGRR
jgi:Tol biopolymer transport system component